MARFGVAMSQEGVPLQRAADYQKVLDDRWPFLDIVYERQIDVAIDPRPGPDRVELREIWQHNLGYIPAFQDEVLYYYTSAAQGYEAGTARIVADDHAIYLWNNISDTSSGFFTNTPIYYRFMIRVYACDITRDFVQPVDFTAARPRRAGSRYGVKALRRGQKDIKSKNKADFTMHTNTKAFAVHQTGLFAADADGEITVSHRLGYPPLFFLAQYAEDNTYTGGAIDALNGKPRLTGLGYNLRCQADGTRMVFRGGQSAIATGARFACLILKDPLETVA